MFKLVFFSKDAYDFKVKLWFLNIFLYFILILFQTAVETAHPGLSSPAASNPSSTPLLADPGAESEGTPSPQTISSPTSSLPDQNCNSVRDLENAMTKHLPKRKPGKDMKKETN